MPDKVDKPKRTQAVLMFCADRTFDCIALPANKGFILDLKERLGFHMVQKLLLPAENTQRMIMPLSERDAFPLDPFGLLKAEEEKELRNVNALALETLYKTVHRASIDQARDKLASAILWAVIASILMVAMFAIMVVKGKIHV